MAETGTQQQDVVLPEYQEKYLKDLLATAQSVAGAGQEIPKYEEFISKASKIFDVKVVVIGRDQSILKAQQERVRGMHTTPLFENEIAKLPNPYFISMELLYLYKQKYLEHLREKLEFPIDVDYKDLVDTNEKYIKGRNIFQPLDKEVKKACEES